MADHTPHAEHDHHGPSVKAYVAVFVALCAFTAVSFVVNYFTREGHISTTIGFLLILGAACCKATLVCAIFMHLKWDWKRLYFMIIPAFVLAPMLVFALLPDLVLYWSNLNKMMPEAAAASHKPAAGH